MNINGQKILRSIFTLFVLCITVILFSNIRKHNSLSLTDYAREHPENNTSSHPTSIASTDSITSAEQISTDFLQNTEESCPVSSLTAAILNSKLAESDRTTFFEGFYCEPLSENLQQYITGISYPESNPQDASSELPYIHYDELRYVHVMHYNFEGIPVEGELICNEAIAQDLIEIFYELYRNEYQIEKMLLIDEYGGDDVKSMSDNNSSCFNYRTIEGSNTLSKHALGTAIDINPLYNPYVSYRNDGSLHISPASSTDYVDRSSSFPYKIDENDLCYKLFIEHGFIWGGNWNNCKDYQHFQKNILD